MATWEELKKIYEEEQKIKSSLTEENLDIPQTPEELSVETAKYPDLQKATEGQSFPTVGDVSKITPAGAFIEGMADTLSSKTVVEGLKGLADKVGGTPEAPFAADSIIKYALNSVAETFEVMPKQKAISSLKDYGNYINNKLSQKNKNLSDPKYANELSKIYSDESLTFQMKLDKLHSFSGSSEEIKNLKRQEMLAIANRKHVDFLLDSMLENSSFVTKNFTTPQTQHLLNIIDITSKSDMWSAANVASNFIFLEGSTVAKMASGAVVEAVAGTVADVGYTISEGEDPTALGVTSNFGVQFVANFGLNAIGHVVGKLAEGSNYAPDSVGKIHGAENLKVESENFINSLPPEKKEAIMETIINLSPEQKKALAELNNPVNIETFAKIKESEVAFDGASVEYLQNLYDIKAYENKIDNKYKNNGKFKDLLDRYYDQTNYGRIKEYAYNGNELHPAIDPESPLTKSAIELSNKEIFDNYEVNSSPEIKNITNEIKNIDKELAKSEISEAFDEITLNYGDPNNKMSEVKFKSKEEAISWAKREADIVNGLNMGDYENAKMLGDSFAEKPSKIEIKSFEDIFNKGQEIFGKGQRIEMRLDSPNIAKDVVEKAGIGWNEFNEAIAREWNTKGNLPPELMFKKLTPEEKIAIRDKKIVMENNKNVVKEKIKTKDNQVEPVITTVQERELKAKEKTFTSKGITPNPLPSKTNQIKLTPQEYLEATTLNNIIGENNHLFGSSKTITNLAEIKGISLKSAKKLLEQLNKFNAVTKSINETKAFYGVSKESKLKAIDWSAAESASTTTRGGGLETFKEIAEYKVAYKANEQKNIAHMNETVAKIMGKNKGVHDYEEFLRYVNKEQIPIGEMFSSFGRRNEKYFKNNFPEVYEVMKSWKTNDDILSTYASRTFTYSGEDEIVKTLKKYDLYDNYMEDNISLDPDKIEIEKGSQHIYVEGMNKNTFAYMTEEIRKKMYEPVKRKFDMELDSTIEKIYGKKFLGGESKVPKEVMDFLETYKAQEGLFVKTSKEDLRNSLANYMNEKQVKELDTFLNAMPTAKEKFKAIRETLKNDFQIEVTSKNLNELSEEIKSQTPEIQSNIKEKFGEITVEDNFFSVADEFKQIEVEIQKTASSYEDKYLGLVNQLKSIGIVNPAQIGHIEDRFNKAFIENQSDPLKIQQYEKLVDEFLQPVIDKIKPNNTEINRTAMETSLGETGTNINFYKNTLKELLNTGFFKSADEAASWSHKNFQTKQGNIALLLSGYKDLDENLLRNSLESGELVQNIADTFKKTYDLPDDLNVRIENKTDQDYFGYYDSKNKEIVLNSENINLETPAIAANTVWHELEHAKDDIKLGLGLGSRGNETDIRYFQKTADRQNLEVYKRMFDGDNPSDATNFFEQSIRNFSKEELDQLKLNSKVPLPKEKLESGVKIKLSAIQNDLLDKPLLHTINFTAGGHAGSTPHMAMETGYVQNWVDRLTELDNFESFAGKWDWFKRFNKDLQGTTKVRNTVKNWEVAKYFKSTEDYADALVKMSNSLIDTKDVKNFQVKLSQSSAGEIPARLIKKSTEIDVFGMTKNEYINTLSSKNVIKNLTNTIPAGETKPLYNSGDFSETLNRLLGERQAEIKRVEYKPKIESSGQKDVIGEGLKNLPQAAAGHLFLSFKSVVSSFVEGFISPVRTYGMSTIRGVEKVNILGKELNVSKYSRSLGLARDEMLATLNLFPHFPVKPNETASDYLKRNFFNKRVVFNKDAVFAPGKTFDLAAQSISNSLNFVTSIANAAGSEYATVKAMTRTIDKFSNFISKGEFGGVNNAKPSLIDSVKAMDTMEKLYDAARGKPESLVPKLSAFLSDSKKRMWTQYDEVLARGRGDVGATNAVLEITTKEFSDLPVYARGVLEKNGINTPEKFEIFKNKELIPFISAYPPDNGYYSFKLADKKFSPTINELYNGVYFSYTPTETFRDIMDMPKVVSYTGMFMKTTLADLNVTGKMLGSQFKDGVYVQNNLISKESFKKIGALALGTVGAVNAMAIKKEFETLLKEKDEYFSNSAERLRNFSATDIVSNAKYNASSLVLGILASGSPVLGEMGKQITEKYKLVEETVRTGEYKYLGRTIASVLGAESIFKFWVNLAGEEPVKINKKKGGKGKLIKIDNTKSNNMKGKFGIFEARKPTPDEQEKLLAYVNSKEFSDEVEKNYKERGFESFVSNVALALEETHEIYKFLNPSEKDEAMV